jgi:mannosylglycerate hydrolase
MQTPEAQMIGPVRASYAVIPHVDDWLASRSYRTAHEYRTPLYGSDTGIHSGRYGLKGGVVDIQGDHTLVMSACKKAESGNALVLRFWNVARERTRARAKMTVPSSGVHLVDLREEPLPDGAIQADADGCFDLEVGPAGIVTVAVTV